MGGKCRDSDSLGFKYGCPAEYTLDTHTLLHKHALLTGRPVPARSHNSAEEEEYQTTGSFVCCSLLKHGHQCTAGSLLRRTRDQPPLRFHSHVREGMFMIIVMLKEGHFRKSEK